MSSVRTPAFACILMGPWLGQACHFMPQHTIACPTPATDSQLLCFNELIPAFCNFWNFRREVVDTHQGTRAGAG